MTQTGFEGLPNYARSVIRAALGGPEAEPPEGHEIEKPLAAFVTLRWPDGELQGCIGTLEPRSSLKEAVREGARSAALRDPRGRKFQLSDVEDLFIEVSVLSPLEEVTFHNEESARAALRPGVDGVVLRCPGHQGTFLPQMWPRLGDAATFLNELKRKAGLRSDFWSPNIRLSRYTVESFKSGEEPPELD